MKYLRNLLLAFVVTASSTLAAQTLNIHTGKVKTAVTASEEQMTFDSGETLTVLGKAFAISDIDSIIVDESTVEDNTILVEYADTTAYVTLAGNIAKYMDVSVTGAHVSIYQSEDVTEELTYTLQGESSDGSFWMDGELKISLVLNGLTLTCADSAAINIRDGKRISVELVDSTTTTLVDGANGSQKGCFVVNGHAEFKGGGNLVLTGNAKHAFFGDEYVELKKSTGTITVLSAVKDGLNVNQYFEMKGGTVTISGVGDDGIQVDATDDDTDELNGQVIISGGTLDISVTATAAKGLKCDSLLTISGGEITITTSGGGEYDSSEKDVSACSCIKGGTDVNITGGTLTLASSGKGGKGLSADGDITIDDGEITITTTGKTYTYGSYDALPKGVKADGNLTINGGDITVTCTGDDGSEGLESKATLTITGGNIIVNSYDDCINASTKIDISGGNIYAYSTNNDAIDSNGTLYISGGLILATGTNTPEEAFDADSNTFSVTGGTLIGVAGDASSPTTSATTQPVIIIKSVTVSSGSYIALANSSGEYIFSYMVPKTQSSGALIISSPDLATGSSYTIYTSATVSGGTSWQGYSEDATVSGGTSVFSKTLSSMITSTTASSSSGSTGPGGSTGGGSTGPGGSTGGGSNSPW